MADLRGKLDAIDDEWRTPIEFYGKVCDESGQPVPDAEVVFGWTDLSDKGHSQTSATSGGDGRFSLTGRTGKHLSVRVHKNGYYSSKRDMFSFFYAGENVNFVPNYDNPVVFHLRKKGRAEPLVFFENDFLAPRDGTPVEVDLVRGRPVKGTPGDIRVQCWTEDQGKGRGERYDWKCLITVSDGGLVLTTNEYNFEAPENGYSTQAEMVVLASKGTGWRDREEREYFLKLGSGKFARMKFKMIAAGGHFFHIECWLNPSGSRNLESDESKIIQGNW